MTTNERRAAWRQYACALLASRERNLVDECDLADSWLESESSRFSTADDELRLARAHALEQQTRAENAEMAMKVVTAQRDEAMRERYVARLERDALQALADERERVAAVPVGELRAALVCARESGSVAQLYDDVLRLVLPAEQRAATAKPAEGGEL